MAVFSMVDGMVYEGFGAFKIPAIVKYNIYRAINRIDSHPGEKLRLIIADRIIIHTYGVALRSNTVRLPRLVTVQFDVRK